MERETINVPLSFEHLLTQLFGQSFYNVSAGVHWSGVWKIYLSKLITAIENSILVNVDTCDTSHKKKLMLLCKGALKKIKEGKNKDELNIAAIESLTRIVFELMGQMPDNWTPQKLKGSVKCFKSWELDGHRKLTYTQTTHQKVMLILSSADSGAYTDRLPGQCELHDKFWHSPKLGGFGGDSNKFIQWFKKEYQDIYLELF